MMLQDPNTASTAAAAAPAPGTSNAEGLQNMGFGHLWTSFISGDNIVGALVFLVLVIFMSMSLYFMMTNIIRNARIRSRSNKVIRTFWDTSNAQDAIQFMEQQPKFEPFSKIALECAEAAAHHQRNEGGRLTGALNRSEFIDRSLRQAVARESENLENGLTVLATVGSTAPFVGLLGTVWGIYHALIGIAASGQSSIEAVAGPVGEALIMTALGLFVAIPAVLGYNFFVRQNRVTNSDFDAFAHDLHDFFATGSRVGDAGAGR
jgi:biopolymer transport protein ExbB